MTKSDWRRILRELKAMRSTDKFKTKIVYYERPIPLYMDDAEGMLEIDKIDVDELYIRFQHRVYLKHADVIDITPSEMRSRFFVTMNVFNIDKVNFK